MAENVNGLTYNPDVNYDDATLNLQKEIEREIADRQPLVGSREDFSQLEQEYPADDEIYQRKIQELKSQYQCLRRTRGDGNCFYRAFGYAYLEKLLTTNEERKRFIELARKSKDALVSLGFPEFTVEDFHEVFMDVLNTVDRQCTPDELLTIFNDQSHSDYLVVYLRLLVSGHLQKDEEFFSAFVDGERTMKQFCNQEVEPMGKESDHIHIIALTTAANIPIRIEYVDRASNQLNHHDFPDNSEPLVYLLYRPGHYDILYK